MMLDKITIMLRKSWYLANILSLDVALGAIGFSALFAKIEHVEIPARLFFLLGSTVWIIYTADHLIDARNASTQKLSERHFFHKKYQFCCWFMIVILSIATFTGAILWLPTQVFYDALMIAACCVFYFFAVHFFQLKFSKELIVCIIYAIGICFLPFSLSTKWSMKLLISWAILTQLAGFNLVIFSYFSQAEDGHMQFPSIATSHPRFTTLLLPIQFWSLLISIGISYFLVDANILWISLLIIFLIITLTLFVIWKFQAYYSINNRYRILGDGMMLLPYIILMS